MNYINVLNKTNEYLKIPSVISNESHFLDYLANDMNFNNYSLTKDKHKLVIKSLVQSEKFIISAHIDRHGLIVNENLEFELASSYYKKKYDMPLFYSLTTFNNFAKKYLNEEVCAYSKNGNILAKGRIKDYFLNYEENYLTYKIEGLNSLPFETPIALKSELKMSGDYVSSQIDNVILVGFIYEMLNNNFKGTIILTSEEEIGKSWQYILEYIDSKTNNPNKLIIFDTSPFSENKYIDNGYIVLRNKDNSGVFNKKLTKNIEKVMIDNNFSYIYKDIYIEDKNSKLRQNQKKQSLGGTELGKIIKHSNFQYSGTTIQLPTIHYHTNYETTTVSAIKNLCKFIKKYFL